MKPSEYLTKLFNYKEEIPHVKWDNIKDDMETFLQNPDDQADLLEQILPELEFMI